MSRSWVSDFGRVKLGRGSDPVFDPVLSFNMHVYHGVVTCYYRVTPSHQISQFMFHDLLMAY